MKTSQASSTAALVVLAAAFASAHPSSSLASTQRRGLAAASPLLKFRPSSTSGVSAASSSSSPRATAAATRKHVNSMMMGAGTFQPNHQYQHNSRKGPSSRLRTAMGSLAKTLKNGRRGVTAKSVVAVDPNALQDMPQEPRGTAPVATTIAKLRAIAFYALTGAVALPLFVVMLAFAPPVILLDRFRRSAEHFWNALWASISTLPLYKTEVVGLENLPGPKEPAVYVANHQSYLDIYTLLANLPRPFKFVSKTSNFLIPIVGWSMYLTGHVGLDRMDRRSQIRLVNDCRRLLENGAQVLLFPEGTRTTTWTEGENPAPVMGSFKKGAFSIAKKAGVPIIPISLVGTGNLMPNGKEGLLFPGSTKMVIHPRIDTEGRNADDVLKEAREAIASALPAGSY